jgi:hypothetical protein
VADLVTELQDERRRLDVLAVDDLSVCATFDLSYHSPPARATSTYHALGTHPGSLVTAELVAACAGSPGTGTGRHR